MISGRLSGDAGNAHRTAGRLSFVLAAWLAAALPGSAQNVGHTGADTEVDRAAIAAHAAGEPSLQEILDRQGYSIDTIHDEVSAQRFVIAGKGKVLFKPIAAFGLVKVCTAGWYSSPRRSAEQAIPPARPEKQTLWRVDAPHNKRDSPPLMEGAKTEFTPGQTPFGLWVSTAGFKDETVCTEDALQVFVPRFAPNDRHKAHVYPVKKGTKIVPNAYIIGWEYSTNNDNQDIVTLVTNVRPEPAAASR